MNQARSSCSFLWSGEVKSSALWLLQGVVLIWLLWWGFFAILIPFNESTDPAVLSCDTDGEALAGFAMRVIWFTTAAMVTFSLYIRFWQQAKSLWFINTIALIFSLMTLLRYSELLEYSQRVQQYCH
jgi:hypothetical protein